MRSANGDDKSGNSYHANQSTAANSQRLTLTMVYNVTELQGGGYL